MAKISPVSIKYMIHASFEASGPVEKPDVIGAIFGQTEGLLGSELEIRDLQKEGKIGRIEVETESANGKTHGVIKIPTALDQSETSLIAAAIETIDRVGPTEAKITIEKIEDVRGNKRDYILDRAKKLLEGMQNTNSKEISGIVKTGTRAMKVQSYGAEELPAGDIESEEEVIVVEGRADVINLLENRVYNVIGMNGTKLPKAIIELSRKKKITLFLDGDRGGQLIAKNVIENADIHYVAFAPDGKEVEELSGKEILASLRKKIPAREFSSYSSRQEYSNESNQRNNREKESEELKKIDNDKLKRFLDKEVDGSKKVFILNSNLEVLRSGSASKLRYLLNGARDAYVIAIDGKATSKVIRIIEESNVRYLAAKNFTETSSNIEFISF
ncbi:hypothetical protein COX97_00220 [Candidatus Pacearchaeota archaeon CG_4_10_14_0_2_um_filter_05_32_18]|nr:MAG: hypothetical protein COX97_00220 [Candidatus Pacearchaeota archaeon CG_4_10_14_0_2_um_filter_05_32_18]